jgi:hypothetical protein
MIFFREGGNLFLHIHLTTHQVVQNRDRYARRGGACVAIASPATLGEWVLDTIFLVARPSLKIPKGGNDKGCKVLPWGLAFTLPVDLVNAQGSKDLVC